MMKETDVRISTTIGTRVRTLIFVGAVLLFGAMALLTLGLRQDRRQTNSVTPSPVAVTETATNQALTSAGSFRFISWADTKSARATLSTLSDLAVPFNPAFTIYPGDLESSGFTSSGMNAWRDAMNGTLTGAPAPNGMFAKTFPVRGNHDDSNTTGWQGYFNFSQTATSVGATNFTSMSGKDDLVYSFDYGNAHFVALDVPGDAIGSGIPNDQIAWLDTDLTAAEGRGRIHAFLTFHGPIYCVDGHCSGCSSKIAPSCEPSAAFIAVLNAHPIVTATFHGHEHLYSYTYVDATRIPSLTHPIYEFITGAAGAGPSPCDKPNRYEYCMAAYGFAVVDVDGLTVTVNIYRQDNPTTPARTVIITKSGVTPVISNLSVSTTYNAAVVSWQTDIDANSTIEYGTTASYGQSVTEPSYVKNRALTISGLTANTTYYYRVRSVSQTGSEAVSGGFTFKTQPAPRHQRQFFTPAE